MSGASLAGAGAGVLQTNQALREWAVALRQWSRSTREASLAQRERARAFQGGGPPSRSSDVSRPTRQGRQVEPGLPGLGEVGAGELLTLLLDRHGLAPGAAERALTAGMLEAGYPAGFTHVSAVDAFDVIDYATRRHRH